MKAVIAIAVVTCFLGVASAQDPAQCASRQTQLRSCISMFSAGSGTTAFCNDCANTLISYYNDCAKGVGVSAVQKGKPKHASYTGGT